MAMTEAEWLACTEPIRMLAIVRRTASSRKARLFSCGLCRSLSYYLVDKRSRQVIETAEKYADGLIGRVELQTAVNAARCAQGGRASKIVPDVGYSNPAFGMDYILRMIVNAQDNIVSRLWSQKVLHQAPYLLRCVFANPHRSIVAQPAWLAWNDGTVRRIAQAIYDEHAFDGMPILADALEDAGCDNADILRHCREPGVHVRGCWVIDLLLAKE
jgi:hypothetical protein